MTLPYQLFWFISLFVLLAILIYWANARDSVCTCVAIVIITCILLGLVVALDNVPKIVLAGALSAACAIGIDVVWYGRV
jgi:lipid-A-disaccharide synthase-like uncharacterized protein